MTPPYATFNLRGPTAPAIHLSSGKVISLTPEEYAELRSFFVPSIPVYAPVPGHDFGPLTPRPYEPTVTC